MHYDKFKTFAKNENKKTKVYSIISSPVLWTSCIIYPVVTNWNSKNEKFKTRKELWIFLIPKTFFHAANKALNEVKTIFLISEVKNRKRKKLFNFFSRPHLGNRKQRHCFFVFCREILFLTSCVHILIVWSFRAMHKKKRERKFFFTATVRHEK